MRKKIISFSETGSVTSNFCKKWGRQLNFNAVESCLEVQVLDEMSLLW